MFMQLTKGWVDASLSLSMAGMIDIGERSELKDEK